MTRPLRLLTAAGLMLAASLTAVTGGTALANTQICDKYGSTTIEDRYVVMNNRWGADTAQCINVTSTGFAITADHHKPTNGAPAAYTAVYFGCHYDNCSPGTNLPMQVRRIGKATSSASFAYPDSGIYNVSYDVWLDPAPNTHGTNQQELMIWFAKRGPIHPVGSRVASVTIGGRSWDVWSGYNGSSDVVSYVAQSSMTKWSFDVMDFVDDVRTRSKVTDAWYLTSVQAGFEPWVGGTGLAATTFSAAVTAGVRTPHGSPSPSRSHAPSRSAVPAPTSAAPSASPSSAEPAPAAKPTSDDRHSGSVLWPVIGAVVVVLLLAGGWLWTRRRRGPQPG
ncbi:glycosyl hydrolase family 5 [Dactylosporangium sp. NPDC048998]|uniref:GH12 family glycosyl hydrolase domain-containing protein n=1 Tax=Dactylosporangium sp. NPDC048998 TaxID=3363976 RepID=UPI003716BD18